jgi:hypothetical protein
MMKVIDPIKEIKKALPELETIDNNYNNIKYITKKAWNNRLKTICTKSIKKYGKSISFVGLSYYFMPCILEYRDNDTMIINEVKYKIIRKYVITKVNEGRLLL